MPIDAGIRARRFLPPWCTGVVTEEAADPDRALSDAKKVRASPSVWSVRKSPSDTRTIHTGPGRDVRGPLARLVTNAEVQGPVQTFQRRASTLVECGADVAERVDHGVHVRRRKHSRCWCTVDLRLCGPSLGLRAWLIASTIASGSTPAAIAAW